MRLGSDKNQIQKKKKSFIQHYNKTQQINRSMITFINPNITHSTTLVSTHGMMFVCVFLYIVNILY